MKQGLCILASSILFAACLTGCEDAGKRPAQARVPALQPGGATAATQAPPTLPSLPLTNASAQPLISLRPPVPGGKEYLIQKVQERFASGEQNFKAGHLEAARKDFDDAVDWMLESGYDPEGDARAERSVSPRGGHGVLLRTAGLPRRGWIQRSRRPCRRRLTKSRR